MSDDGMEYEDIRATTSMSGRLRRSSIQLFRQRTGKDTSFIANDNDSMEDDSDDSPVFCYKVQTLSIDSSFTSIKDIPSTAFARDEALGLPEISIERSFAVEESSVLRRSPDFGDFKESTASCKGNPDFSCWVSDETISLISATANNVLQYLADDAVTTSDTQSSWRDTTLADSKSLTCRSVGSSDDSGTPIVAAVCKEESWKGAHPEPSASHSQHDGRNDVVCSLCVALLHFNPLTAKLFFRKSPFAPNNYFTLCHLASNYFFPFLTPGTKLFFIVYFSADHMILFYEKSIGPM